LGYFDLFILGSTVFTSYMAISLTLNLEFGLTGIPNFGKVLFVASGGMLGASVTYRLALYIYNLHSNDIFEASPGYSTIIQNHLVAQPLPIIGISLTAIGLMVVLILVGAFSAGALGYLASYPAIRLREDYLGMLLLGCGVLFSSITAYYIPVVGGPENLVFPDLLSGYGSNEQYVILGIFVVFAVLVFLYSERVLKSPLGRTLKAIRDNEVASEALGKDNVNMRRKILVISSALSGVAGALWVIYWSQKGGLVGGDVNATFSRLLFTFYPFTIVILGGMASNLGVVLGSAALSIVFVGTGVSLPSLVQNIKIPGVDPSLLNDFINSLQYVLIGGLLLAVLLLRPEGLVKERPTFTMPKEKLRKMAEFITGSSDSKQGSS
jgi:branched-chain amino acid transport system permease protein